MRRRDALLLSVCLPLASLLPGSVLASTDGEPSPERSAKDAELLQFLDRAFDEDLLASPEEQTRLGLKTGNDRLNDYTDAAQRRALARAERQLGEMRARFNPEQLGAGARISFRLFEYEVRRRRDAFRFRQLSFPVSTNGSPAGDVPALLINNHKVAAVSDAEAYIARLKDTKRVMLEVADTMRQQAAAGIVPNRSNFASARGDAYKVITGAPFDSGPESALMADFAKKVAQIEASAERKAVLLSKARDALVGPFRAGYQSLIAALEEIEPKANGNLGVWSLPGGAGYYAERLRAFTTTRLTADQIHEIGIKQVAAIRAEMDGIKRQVAFDGTLAEFFERVRTDPSFKYANTDAGREEYLSDARDAIASAMAAAPRFFRVLPKAPIEVRAVETWRERTAPTAFYSPPSADGTRPGIFYVNLVDLSQTQKFQVAGIAMHEAAPGHHFQVARQQELVGLPKFRKFGGYGAYAEGWGLYAERLADEMGIYKNPYERFGMLSLQIWRAIRLVLDTGIHSRRWTREQAIAYFRANSSVSDADIAREVDRYFNLPGQATSYMVGQLKIAELRARAEQRLGKRFDVRDFHEAVLSQGAIPLDVLEGQIDRYIAVRSRG